MLVWWGEWADCASVCSAPNRGHVTCAARPRLSHRSLVWPAHAGLADTRERPLEWSQGYCKSVLPCTDMWKDMQQGDNDDVFQLCLVYLWLFI